MGVLGTLSREPFLIESILDFNQSRFWISINRSPTDCDGLVVGFSEFPDFFGWNSGCRLALCSGFFSAELVIHHKDTPNLVFPMIVNPTAESSLASGLLGLAGIGIKKNGGGRIR